MQKRLLPALLSAAFLVIIIGFGCTKIDTTTLGSDLVAIDNINTFADTLSVSNATQGPFINDSTILGKRENHIIGNITSDPLFGATESAIFVQFKPTFYPFFFGNAGDTVKNNINAGLDSAFVCLSFRGIYGDSSAMAVAQTFEITQIVDEDFRVKTDTLRRLNYKPTLSIPAPPLGSVTITPQIIKKKIVFANRKDSVENQIRIQFNTPAGIAFINSFYNNQDSSFSNLNNAFSRDSAFRKMLHGFAITSRGAGNTLYYVNLEDAKSRLEFHFRKTKNGVKDTIVQSFQMYSSRFGNIAASSSANFIQRDYTGSAAASPSTSEIFLQTAPGTYANINIPGLTGYSNRIVHRAFLVVEQTPFNSSDNIFTAPPFLYLDLKDTATTLPQRYKPVYFDLIANVPYDPDALTSSALFHPFPAANVDVNNFGGVARDRFEASGTRFTRYEINLTRYVQHIVTNGYRNYDLRLYAPFNYTYPQYSGTKFLIPFYNPIAFGRVRVGSGTSLAHRMRLIVIYSKI